MLLSSEGSFFPQLAGALPPHWCGSGEAASAGRGGFARPAASVLSVSGQVRHPRAAQPVPEMTSLPLRFTVASPQTPGFPAALARGWLLSRRRAPCREPRGLHVRGLRVHVASACTASACTWPSRDRCRAGPASTLRAQMSHGLRSRGSSQGPSVWLGKPSRPAAGTPPWRWLSVRERPGAGVVAVPGTRVWPQASGRPPRPCMWPVGCSEHLPGTLGPCCRLHARPKASARGARRRPFCTRGAQAA